MEKKKWDIQKKVSLLRVYDREIVYMINKKKEIYSDILNTLKDYDNEIIKLMLESKIEVLSITKPDSLIGMLGKLYEEEEKDSNN